MKNKYLKQVYIEADTFPWKKYKAQLLPLMCEYGFDIIALDYHTTSSSSLLHAVFERSDNPKYC